MKSSVRKISSALKALAASPGGLFDVEPSELDLNVGRHFRFDLSSWTDRDGTIERDYEFVIRGVQKNFRGQVGYRVHALNFNEDGSEEEFGRYADPSRVIFLD